MHPLIFVTYDGIENSVGTSQVLVPLAQRQKEFPHQPIHLISFERTSVQYPDRMHYSFPVHLLKRLPFLGMLSMWHSVYALKKMLASFPSYELIARGPLAGYVCLKALHPSHCQALIIQARGLLAEEYQYAHLQPPPNSFIRRLWHRWRARALEKIERSVYGTAWRIIPSCTIEAVSSALKEYLIATYHTPAKIITIAHRDIPAVISAEQKKPWRQEIRRALAIPEDAQVYCYNGSVKAWQCPEMTVAFFKQQVEKDRNSFLLVLTMDKEPFLRLLAAAGIKAERYRMVTVAHQEVYKYLAASDTGIIFRMPSIVNWVSRPTKVLEYRAAGLQIVHNHTVEMLCRE